MKKYTVTIGGIEHVLLLDAEDAERYGDAAKAFKAPAKKVAVSSSSPTGAAGSDDKS